MVKSKDTDAAEAPCPPVVSSLKGDKIEPVAAQMASYLVCLRYDARCALVRTSLRGSCSRLPADVLLGKLKKDISFALRRGTIAQVTKPSMLAAAEAKHGQGGLGHTKR